MDKLEKYLSSKDYRVNIAADGNSVVISNVTTSDVVSLINGLNFSIVDQVEAVVIEVGKFSIRYK